MNNLQRTTFSMVLGGAIMLMSGIVTTVVADYMRFPATICQLWGGDREHTEALSYSQFGRLENTHGSQRIGIVCPIPLHNIPIVQNVIVYYDDNNPSVQSTGTLSCRLRNNNIWGTSSNESQGRNTGNDADGLASGEWHFQDVDTQSFQWEWFHTSLTLFCQLPPEHNGNTSSIGTIVVEY